MGERDQRFNASSPSPKKGDVRTPAERDRDRILYSSAFRRLAEVTQVVAASSGYVFHNRLTHSQQVAQVARRLAERLNRVYPTLFTGGLQLNPDVVEAAAMAHDLGHPPFGHVIEEELNELALPFGGFEGNAQSFRIVSKLAFHSEQYQGLNLTKATLAAILKYPWLKGENSQYPHKWGAYESERSVFDFARKGLKTKEQTLEARLMDWADDITYSVHDLEDFYRAGRIPLHLLAAEEDDTERQHFMESLKQRLGNTQRRSDEEWKRLEAVLRDLLVSTFAPTQPYRGTQRQRAQLRSFTGSLIARYVGQIAAQLKDGRVEVIIFKEYRDEVFMLKQLTWTYVIEDPALATQQFGQRKMIRDIYNAYAEAARDRKHWRIFPTYYQEKLAAAASADERNRACVDLIAGMTETQVYRIYQRISGYTSDPSLSDPFS